MKFTYIDCEFVPHDLTPTGLISIGLVTETSSYYAVNASMDTREACRRDWMVENVWKHLPHRGKARLDYTHPEVKDYGTIREEVSLYFKELCPSGNSRKDIRTVANHGAPDIIRLHTLWNNDWGVMPKWIPRHLAYDLATLEDDAGAADGVFPDGELLPVMLPDREHHALWDAYYNQEVHEAILRKAPHLGPLGWRG